MIYFDFIWIRTIFMTKRANGLFLVRLVSEHFANLLDSFDILVVIIIYF